MADPPDWDPEDELDPVKVYKAQVEATKVMKEILKKAAEEEARRAKAEEDHKNDILVAGERPPEMAMAFGVPSFREVSEKLRLAWRTTLEIAPDASPAVQVYILQSLERAPVDDGVGIEEEVAE